MISITVYNIQQWVNIVIYKLNMITAYINKRQFSGLEVKYWYARAKVLSPIFGDEVMDQHS